MTDRIIDIAESPARLHLRLGQLVIERADRPEVTVPLEDLAVLVVSNPAVSYTNALLAEMSAQGAVLVVCDERHIPAAMMLPLAGNALQGERIARQITAPLPLRKRLWQALARAKVHAQAALLVRRRGGDGGLRALAARVRSGDPENIEAQAARRYWPLLFDSPDFHRRPDGPPPNNLLNYGYAVLRATAARAVCAAGLHPSIGLHHHNRYDAYCLADDLVEPFRPLVDEAVLGIVERHGPEAPLAGDVKRELLATLTGQVLLAGESRTLFDALSRLAVSLAEAYAGERKNLELPEF